MSDGLNLDGFATSKPAGKNNVAPEQYASAPRAAFPAKDVSTQGKAGFNAEGSYDTAGESNAYPESENM